MKKVYGQYLDGTAGEKPIFYDGHEVILDQGEDIWCNIKACGVRPNNIYTNGTGGCVDELDLVLCHINNKDVIIGCVECRIGVYLYYTFTEKDEKLIRDNVTTEEKYWGKHKFFKF